MKTKKCLVQMLGAGMIVVCLMTGCANLMVTSLDKGIQPIVKCDE